MSELKGACIFGQSGGPTSVINASAYGVIETALKNPNITRVLGAEHGIKGVLNDRLFDMGQEDPTELELLKYTPSSALGSCRYKMADPDMDDTDYKRILEIFKKHIRLYDKGAGLLFPEDVKRYFSNYIAAGSVTCRTLRETLLKELENTVDKDVNRFESVVDGRRTYLGHLIPADAPPRPDASAVWDDVKKRWAH